MLGGARPGADQMLGRASRLGADRMLTGDADGNASRELKSHGEGDVGAQSAECQNAVFRSTVVESINALREEVANLRLEFGQIKKLGDCFCASCSGQVVHTVSHIGKARLESLLGC